MSMYINNRYVTIINKVLRVFYAIVNSKNDRYKVTI